MCIFSRFCTFCRRKSGNRRQNGNKHFSWCIEAYNSVKILNTVSKYFIYFFFTPKTVKNGHFCLSEIVGNCRKKPTSIAFII